MNTTKKVKLSIWIKFYLKQTFKGIAEKIGYKVADLKDYMEPIFAVVKSHHGAVIYRGKIWPKSINGLAMAAKKAARQLDLNLTDGGYRSELPNWNEATIDFVKLDGSQADYINGWPPRVAFVHAYNVYLSRK